MRPPDTDDRTNPYIPCDWCRATCKVEDLHWTTPPGWDKPDKGGLDATCPNGHGWWRYVFTPATGWVRAIDLNAYHANNGDNDVYRQWHYYDNKKVEEDKPVRQDLIGPPVGIEQLRLF